MKRIAFIGGGNMARSLIGGLLARGHARERLRVAEPHAATREALIVRSAFSARLPFATQRPEAVVSLNL